jgi:hypothetical protein
VREKLKDSYSETGRPSIDPELLLRILLIGYLYGITRERKLVEELHPLKSSAFHGALLRISATFGALRFANIGIPSGTFLLLQFPRNMPWK